MSIICAVRPLARPRLATLALVAAALTCSPSARAVADFDEVMLYMTSGSFVAGGTATTTFFFGSKPAVDLSAVTFQLSWDNALATPVASGPGSVAAWAALLDAKGDVTLDFGVPQVITLQWTADPGGGSASWINTDYSHPVTATFGFETSASLSTPFAVRFELTDIKNFAGETMSTGSGFFNGATLSPVPEPSGWLAFTGGLVGLWSLRRRWCETTARGLPL